MNSLVVLFSLVALAAAKPSGLLESQVISYAAPAITTFPAAVSSQSRIDIKSSPGIVATAAVAPIARTVIAQPALVAAPVAIAPAAVSHQSRIDIKSSPEIVSSVITAPFATAAIAPAVVKTLQPAFVKTIAAPAFAAYPTVLNSAIAAPIIAAHGAIAPSVPLDTPEVIAARAAHFEAKALAGDHFIHKRSAPLLTPGYTTYAASPIVSTYAAAPLVHAASPIVHAAHITYSSPLIHTPLIAKAYSVHPW